MMVIFSVESVIYLMDNFTNNTTIVMMMMVTMMMMSVVFMMSAVVTRIESTVVVWEVWVEPSWIKPAVMVGKPGVKSWVKTIVIVSVPDDNIREVGCIMF